METSTPSPLRTPPPEVRADDPLDALLKRLAGGWFILTDGQGAVSKWSEPAELLFGKEAPDALGHSFFDGLLTGPLGEDAEQWRRFLAAGDAPRARALVEVTARHAPSDATFPLEAVFVPVRLEEGFDFSLFLEDLSFELPLNLMLLRVRQQHPVVVRALRAALDAEPQPWDGGRTAGTLVAFRPLAPTPWVEAELARREEERARADAEREEAITNPDPGVQGESVDDLDDAAAVVARMLSALERIEDLERVAGGLPGQLAAARQEAQAARVRAETAELEARTARAELERLGDGEPSVSDVLARLETLERAAGERLQRLESERLESAAAVEARLTAAATEARDDRHALELRLAELEHSDDGDQIARLAADAETLRSALGGIDQRLDAAREESRARADAARTVAHDASERVAEIDRRTDAVLAELATVRAVADQADAGATGLRAELEALRAETAAARAEAAAARAEAAAAREEAAALREEARLRESEQSETAGGEQMNAMFKEILGLAAKGRSNPLHTPAETLSNTPREPRHGFDDDATPLAVVGTDGRFKQLNPSFCRLVGYQEHEFAKAAWPSPHDRQLFAQQQQQLAELVSGTLQSVPVRSTYMHGQGLMIPVVGEITAVKGEDGLTSHLLLRAEERERAI